MRAPLSVVTAVLILSGMSAYGSETQAQRLFPQRDVLPEIKGAEPFLPDSLNVRVVGRWPFGPADAVCVEGNYTYLGSGGGIYVLDSSNPANPTKVAEVTAPGVVWGLFCSGSYLYVADVDAGLRVIDVSDPSNPVEVGFYDTPGWAYGVYVSGTYAHVADQYAGLIILEFYGPGVEERDQVAKVRPLSLTISPNPAKGRTAIAYSIPAFSPISLGLYDGSGRLIRSLEDGHKSGGTHRVRLDGEPLPPGVNHTLHTSGVYFLRLKAGEEARSEKLLLLH